MKKLSGTAKLNIALLIVIVVGLAFVSAGYFVYRRDVRYKKNGIETEAIIARIDVVYRGGDSGKYDHHVYIDYEVDGQWYYNRGINRYSSNMYVGKKITVYYMPNDPNDVSYVGVVWLFPLVFGGIGGSFVIIGTIIILKIRRSDKTSQQQESRFFREE